MSLNNVRRLVLAVVATVAFSAFGASAQANIYSFTQISNNGNTPVASQLQVEVTDAGGGLVAFKFTNTGTVASSITDIYFQDGSLLAMGTISYSTGVVAFTAPATPGDLSGGNSLAVNFETTQNWSLDSDQPIAVNGVNPGEWVMVTFSLLPDMDYQKTLEAIAVGRNAPGTAWKPDGAGDDWQKTAVGLRFGLHVQAIGVAGGSESFINGDQVTTIPPGGDVPEPTTIVLWSTLTVVGLVYRARRKVA